MRIRVLLGHCACRLLLGLLFEGLGDFSCDGTQLLLTRVQGADRLRDFLGFFQSRCSLRLVVQLGLTLRRLAEMLHDRKEEPTERLQVLGGLRHVLPRRSKGFFIDGWLGLRRFRLALLRHDLCCRLLQRLGRRRHFLTSKIMELSCHFELLTLCGCLLCFGISFFGLPGRGFRIGRFRQVGQAFLNELGDPLAAVHVLRLKCLGDLQSAELLFGRQLFLVDFRLMVFWGFGVFRGRCARLWRCGRQAAFDLLLTRVGQLDQAAEFQEAFPGGAECIDCLELLLAGFGKRVGRQGLPCRFKGGLAIV